MFQDMLEALKYPIAGETMERPLLVGWILVLVSSLVPVLPLVPFFGYLVRVLVRSAAGDTGAPPALTNDLDTVRLGVNATVVCVVYLATPVVLLVVTVGGFAETARFFRTSTGLLVFSLSATVGLVLLLLSSYLLPVALVTYGRKRHLSAAFEYRTIRALARSTEMFVGWAATVAIGAVGAVIAVDVFNRSRFGPVLAALVITYTLVLVSHRLGVGIARAEQ
jgi:hypothetical protein